LRTPLNAIKGYGELLIEDMALHAQNPMRAAPRAEGADLFISYSQQDKGRIEPLAAAFTRGGWSVWWDRELKSGEIYDRIIEKAIQQARAVLVAWSKNSVESDWVRAEAAYALEKKKLLSTRLDDATPPLRFLHLHYIDLLAWDGGSAHPAFQTLLADVAALIGKPAGK